LEVANLTNKVAYFQRNTFSATPNVITALVNEIALSETCNMSFQEHYRELFATFGYSLSKSAATSPAALDKKAMSLGVALPAALRDYYLVAGREKRFNQSFQRLLPPSEWTVDRKRLVFMEENQAVVLWGVSLNSAAEDPVVWQRINDDESPWQRECRRCSEFLAVMLHLNAVSGGFEYIEQGNGTTPKLLRRIKARFKCYGTANGLTAYSRPNQAICIESSMGVMGGAKTQRELDLMLAELSAE
jgi:hypothetical protein